MKRSGAAAAAAALAYLLLAQPAALASGTPQQNSDGLLPLSWEVSGTGEEPRLESPDGTVIPWAKEPEPLEAGGWLVRPPLLPEGRYVLVQGERKDVLQQGLSVKETAGEAQTALIAAAIIGLAAAVALRRRPYAAALIAAGTAGILLFAAAGRPDLTELDVCTYRMGAAEYESCVRTAASAYFHAGGEPEVLMARIEALHPAEEWGPEPCHAGAHVSGEEWQQQGGSMEVEAAAFRCEMGFMHGMQAAAAVGVPTSRLPEETAEACRQVEARLGERAGRECQHGRGHAMMVRTGGDLDAALGMCSRDRSQEDLCRMGAIMEWQLLWREAEGEPGRRPLPDILPHQLCMRDIETAIDVCLLDTFVTYRSMAGGEWPAGTEEIAAECVARGGEEARHSCGSGIGSFLAAGTSPDDIIRISELCREHSDGDTYFQKGCYSGAHSTWLATGSSRDEVAEACVSVGSPMCREALDGLLQAWDSGNRA